STRSACCVWSAFSKKTAMFMSWTKRWWPRISVRLRPSSPLLQITNSLTRLKPISVMPDRSTDSMSALARGVSLNLYGSAFNMMTRLLFNVLVARLLGPSEVGIYFIALSVANLLSVLAVGGLDTTLVRYLSKQRLSEDWGGFRGTLRIVLQTGACLG